MKWKLKKNEKKTQKLIPLIEHVIDRKNVLKINNVENNENKKGEIES